MLQRIQTIFLAIAIVGMGLFLAFPIWNKVSSTGGQKASLTSLTLTRELNATQSNVTPVYYLVILAILVAAVAGYAILQYKNRVLQSALCAVNSILMTILMGLVLYFTFYKSAKLFEPALPGKYDIGFFGLVGAMLANVFANRFIRKDERTVQQSKRFR